ncbi:MAG: LPXTG cell wall anchor domain-containing protein [Nocardioidaceae bacterium]|nr:LPXTG cell wall anchor domain-containing protein [Nocardioidaceae bacterium]
MTRLASGVLLALVTVLAVSLGAPGPALAAPKDPAFTLKVDRHTVRGGQTLTATATAQVVCDWIIEWNGERRHVRATRIVTSYVAPTVARPTKMPLRGTCVVAPAPIAGPARSTAQPDQQSVVVRVPPHSSHTVGVTVLPPGTDVSPPDPGGGVGGEGTGPGGLPSTGGPPLWLLAAGLGALLAGALVVRRAQRDPGLPVA